MTWLRAVNRGIVRKLIASVVVVVVAIAVHTIITIVHGQVIHLFFERGHRDRNVNKVVLIGQNVFCVLIDKQLFIQLMC